MTDADKKSPKGSRINEKQRYSYIGFEVFPGKPKDLFKNQAEQDKLVEKITAKRAKGGFDREGCTLIEERVSFGERLVLAVSSVIMLCALLLPWYSAYTEVPIVAEAEPQAVAVVDDSLALVGDSLSLAEDSLAVAAAPLSDSMAAVEAEAVAALAVEEAALASAAEERAADEAAGVTRHVGERSNEEILTGHTIRKAVNKEYASLSGLGTFAALGSAGSAVFSSGFILIISGVLMLVYALLCIGLPVLNLYSLFGLKGSADDNALMMKKYLRFNWLPVLLFTAVVILSFIGADYGFDVSESFTSIGQSYGVGALLGTLSWGVFVSMAASILVAVKGIEI